MSLRTAAIMGVFQSARGLGLWTFPADYPRRVGDALYPAAPQLRRDVKSVQTSCRR